MTNDEREGMRSAWEGRPQTLTDVQPLNRTAQIRLRRAHHQVIVTPMPVGRKRHN